ncbi:DUF6448 family protein [Cellulomonas soli]
MPITRITHRLTALLAALRPVVVEAHCDTADGPAVTAGRRALETGNLNHALPWIPAAGENELRAVFDAVLRVRALGEEPTRVADRLFLETLVRLHRAGEGVGFTGIQPTGAALDPVVAAADAALASGSDKALLALVAAERRDELHARFGEAIARQGYDVDDVAAGRRFLEAYVAFMTWAEGEDGHDHAHDGHAHEVHAHGAHQHDHVGR